MLPYRDDEFGEPPYRYENAEEYRTDIRRIARIVVKTPGETR